MSGKTLANKSQTDENKKDFWNTDWRALRDAQFLVGEPFALDVCAQDAWAAKAPTYISPEQDALKTDWATIDGAIWCNPPFTRKPEFLTRAYEQSKKWRRSVIVMLPFEPATDWWREYVSNKASVVYVPDGRYGYLDNDTKELIPGVNFVSCFLLFSPIFMPTKYVEYQRWCGKSLMQFGDEPRRAKVKKKVKVNGDS